MVLSTHFVTGAALAGFSDSPILLFFSAIVLHFALDSIPHWEYLDEFGDLKQRWPLVISDIFLGPSLILLITFSFYGLDLFKLWPFFFSGAVSVLPDGLSFLHFIWPRNKLLRKIFDWHEFIHNKRNLSFKQGFLPQVAINLMAVLVIFLLSKP